MLDRPGVGDEVAGAFVLPASGGFGVLVLGGGAPAAEREPQISLPAYLPCRDATCGSTGWRAVEVRWLGEFGVSEAGEERELFGGVQLRTMRLGWVREHGVCLDAVRVRAFGG